MTFTLIALEHDEDFIQFIDPDLVNIKETIEDSGLRTLHVEYMFQDFLEDKEMFKLGNKLWLANDDNISNCLYVINTVVTEDVYAENSFTFDAEEVLVELNYAPLFSQTEITKSNFSVSTTNGKQEVKVDWNALNYWFGAYFNIGVVQDCIQDYSQKIAVTGTMTRMSLLRYIEEETGNVFVTRYEKDLNDNTIHRYLDFLNPVNPDKNWVLNLEYDFLDDTTETVIYDENGDPTDEPETTIDNNEPDDVTTFDTVTKEDNIDTDNLIVRITDGRELIYADEDTPLQWDTVEFPEDENKVAFTIEKQKDIIGLAVNSRSYAIVTDTAGGTSAGYLDPSSLAELDEIEDATLPDNCYLELYDNTNERVVYQTQINHHIGTVHTDILDFGYNVDNITYEIDETDTYTAISPILSLDNGGGSNSLSRADMTKIINNWKNLAVTKGTVVPMIVQKITQAGASLTAAKQALGNYDSSTPDHSTSITNWWSRPLKPNDQAGQTYEFWKGTAYWRAPFTKKAGEIHITTDTDNQISYDKVMTRPDNRDSRGIIFTDKMGTVETSDEDMYAIFNDVCMKLKDKQNPTVNITVDVANLRNGKYNQYNIHDKVYVKLPDSQDIVTCRVTGTTKEPHDIAQNTITLSNYSIKNSKVVQDTVYIQASNTSFKYPNGKNIQCRLINADYIDPTETPNKLHYPANKLITFAVYKNENGNLTPTKKVYNKRTNANGYASISFKDNPGKYEIEITYGGDEEFSETSTTIQVTISGASKTTPRKQKKKVTKKNKKTVKKTTTKTTTKNTTKSKTTKKTAKGGETLTTYDKYGRSPNKTTILAIGKKTIQADTGQTGIFYETEYKNKCPHCGKEQTLIWSYNWAGDERKTRGTFPVLNEQKGSNQNGLICCSHCHTSYSVLGNNISTTEKLTKTKSTIKSDKSQAYLLKQGKVVYGAEARIERWIEYNTIQRTIIGSPSEYIQQKAINIVGNSTGIAAAQKIAAYMGTIQYADYGGFKRTPDETIKRGSGNCCDQTRTMLTLMDAAGCSEYLTLKYVLVCCSNGGIGHIFAKLINNSTKYGNSNYRYVDPTKVNPWGNYCKGWGSLPGSEYAYPTRPDVY